MKPTKDGMRGVLNLMSKGIRCQGDIVTAIRALIERADDVDRLVSVARVILGHTEYSELRAALAPFMEKERGDVPVFNEEGFSNEDKKR